MVLIHSRSSVALSGKGNRFIKQLKLSSGLPVIVSTNHHRQPSRIEKVDLTERFTSPFLV